MINDKNIQKNEIRENIIKNLKSREEKSKKIIRNKN